MFIQEDNPQKHSVVHKNERLIKKEEIMNDKMCE